jgi:glyoxylase-like metal-dependent hydrolase (beta-lactamase superfamily II)
MYLFCVTLVKLCQDVHSIDGLEHPFIPFGITPYLVEEGSNDLTLIDTCFLKDVPKLEAYLREVGYNIKDINRIVLTHVHIDHTQAANEIKKSSGGHAKVYSHWAEAGYLANNPQYHGPPTHEAVAQILQNYGIRNDDLVKKFGSFEREQIIVDHILKDGDMVGKKLLVVHTPGHTPGHISLYLEKKRIIFGADSLFKSVMDVDGLYIPPSEVSIDPATAAISAARLSQLKCDKLFLSHQDSRVLERAQEAIQRAAQIAIRNLNP